MKTNFHSLRPRLTRQMIAAFGTLMLMISSLPATAADTAPLKSLQGLHLALIDGQISLNCKMKTPELCVSRKDIRISPQTSDYMKQTIANMAPGEARYAKLKSDIKALNEENARLKGTGEEFKIAQNVERLVQLGADTHPDYYALQHTPFLWDDSQIKFGSSKNGSYKEYDFDEQISQVTISHGINLPLISSYQQPARFLTIGNEYMNIKNGLFYSYNPNMELSFVLQIDSTIAYGQNKPINTYSSEVMVVRCAERRIFNTLAGVKMNLSERHLLCNLPEKLGFLRFRIIEK